MCSLASCQFSTLAPTGHRQSGRQRREAIKSGLKIVVSEHDSRRASLKFPRIRKTSVRNPHLGIFQIMGLSHGKDENLLVLGDGPSGTSNMTSPRTAST